MKDYSCTHLIFIALAIIWLPLQKVYAQSGGYQFKEHIRLPATSVKDQGRTGTCWCFGTLSFMESELLRMDKGIYDLSEMFVVRQSYLDRAELYMRFHGNINFGPGAEGWDVIHVMKDDGLVPQKTFPGKMQGGENHNHKEMDAVLEGYVDALMKSDADPLSPLWKDGFKGILNAYLGAYPSAFTYRDNRYAPQSFLAKLELDPDDYIPVTAFSNHPYYSQYVFESPDNWSMELIYNVTLDDLIRIIDYSLEQGYTLAWAADVSDPGFQYESGIAVVPGTDWDHMTGAEKNRVFESPVDQKEITMEMRQRAFDNHSTTDDHLMHITGMAKDQKGTKYYIVKNSWGTSNVYDGYLYASEAYVQLKTTSLVVNRNAIPSDIREKLK